MGMFDKEEALEQLMCDVESLLEDLYQSGFDTVHDSTLKALNDMTSRTAAYGMELLSGLLTQLADGLAMRRQQLKKQEDCLLGVYAQIDWYVGVCREKIERDKGRGYYTISTLND